VRDQASVADDREPRAQHGHVLDDVGREQDGAVAREVGEQSVEAIPFFGVEARRGLVHDDQIGVTRDGLRDSESLSHASRVRADPAIGGGAEIDSVEQRGAQSIAPARRIDSLEGQQVFQHGRPGEVRIEAEVLGQVAKPRPDELRMSRHVDPIFQNGPRGGLEKAGEDAHQCRLSRAIRAKEPEHPAGDLQAHALQGRYPSRVHLHEISHLKHGPPLSLHRGSYLASQGIRRNKP
jgi:hypothetical protein